MKIMTFEIKPADLLFVKTHPNEANKFATAISESTGAYTHVAIASSETTVIHATTKHGVVEQTMADFVIENQPVDVFRLADLDATTVLLEADRKSTRLNSSHHSISYA